MAMVRNRHDSRVAWRQKYPEKRAAHRTVKKALDSGKLVRPSSCSKCGGPGPVDAHHQNYLKRLEVEWLCKGCHAKVTNGSQRFCVIIRKLIRARAVVQSLETQLRNF